MIEVVSPYDLAKIKDLPIDSLDEIEKALANARSLADSYDSRLPTEKRIEILEKTADLVAAKSDELALEAAREGGKPLMDSKVELARGIQGIREAASAMKELVGKEIPMNLNPSSANRMAFTTREPIGVVAAVSAFNHPFNLIVHQVIPAVAVGCPVIVKPAMTTPISCYNLVECLYEAGLPKEWCRVILCENDGAEKIVTDTRIDFFSFIGSAKVGWYLRSKLAPGVRCALEHGGAAPVIFDESADIKTALPLLAKGGFYHAGQVCVSVQRIFAHESIADELANGLASIASELKVGDPCLDDTEVGPLILPREVDRVHSWVEEARGRGAKVLAGGEKVSDTCYKPTVLLDPPADCSVSQSEIFGPVVCVYRYSDRHEAIERANALPFSFQASVFSNNLENTLDSVKRINAAAVMVNDHTAFRVDWMPFAGRKHSGMGVGGILPTMEEMTEEKLIVFRSPVLK